ncbi:MAG: 50S ribosomal protein L32 [Candidatus Moranbacteria bacterium]|nr:50S ribosomal protein L32 [Candidatus Moranbacteria bacterium]NTW45641.1 50S ribosomal protein L32 [Candidatus Moranbacteria bacterium]
MALPKQRHTRHRRDRARRELEMTPTQTVSCPKCGTPVVPHRACQKCGEYRGRAVVKKSLPTLGRKSKKQAE